VFKLDSINHSLEIVCGELKLIKKKKQVLESSYKNGKISQSTFEYIMRDLNKVLNNLETQKKDLTEKDLKSSIKPSLEEIKILEDKENIKTEFTKQTKEKKIVYDKKTCNALSNEPKKAFHFYKDVDQPTNIFSDNLKDFYKKIKTLEIESIEFHMSRRDFELWFDYLGENELSKRLKLIWGTNLKGELLRKRIYYTVKNWCSN
jgi:hypothetical protein